MRRLYGTGDFEHVNYRILEEPGKRVLVVDAVEKAWGPNFLRAGIGLSSDFSGSARFNVIASHRMTWLNSLGAELRTDLQLGFNNALRIEFYQPLDVRGRYFIAPRVAIGEDQVDLYRGDERIAIYDIASRSAGLDVGVQFDQYGELRLGVLGGTVFPSSTPARWCCPATRSSRRAASASGCAWTSSTVRTFRARVGPPT